MKPKQHYQSAIRLSHKLFLESWLYLLFIVGAILFASNSWAAECSPLLQHSKRTLAGEQQQNFCQNYGGKVILVVNTASRCGFTYQYEGLEALYAKYREQGLVVLGFPSNDFANQEPGSEQQIAEFCKLTYRVAFPMFEKTSVAAGTKDPFYQALAKQAGESPRWNFHKYLIDRSGKVVGSYNSKIEPQDPSLVKKIEQLLAEKASR